MGEVGWGQRVTMGGKLLRNFYACHALFSDVIDLYVVVVVVEMLGDLCGLDCYAF